MDRMLQSNSLHYGDCLDVLANQPPSFDLVYLDPPFNSKRNYNCFMQGSKSQAKAFKDTWKWGEVAASAFARIEANPRHPAHKAVMGFWLMLGECGMMAYLVYMAERLVAIKSVMLDHATLYLHCDGTAGNYLGILLDGIFGPKSKRNEMAWCYSGGGQPKLDFPRKHDTIFRYSPADDRLFNADDVRIPYDSEYSGTFFPGEESRAPGKVYRPNENGKIREDWIRGISRPYGEERTGWDTQKPVELVEIFIKASSNEGMRVLDPFGGCGTTVIAAHLLDRKWVGIDISPSVLDITEYRLMEKGVHDVPVIGFPVDMRSAQALFNADPFKFEKWAASRIPGMMPNFEKQVGDGGIDGEGFVWSAKKQKKKDRKKVVVQVTGGKPPMDKTRAFQQAARNHDAVLGVFITLHKSSTKGMRAGYAREGVVEIGAERYPRFQFWSIEEHFKGIKPHLPVLAKSIAAGKMSTKGERQMSLA